MLGGGALPLLHPPLLAGRWPAERLRALRPSVAFESSLGGGAPAPPHPPRLLGLRPRAPLERFVIIVVIMDGGSGGGLPPPSRGLSSEKLKVADKSEQHGGRHKYWYQFHITLLSRKRVCCDVLQSRMGKTLLLLRVLLERIDHQSSSRSNIFWFA